MSDGGKSGVGVERNAGTTARKTATREDRLAEALRANLRRRKAQATAREGGPNPEPDTPKGE